MKNRTTKRASQTIDTRKQTAREAIEQATASARMAILLNGAPTVISGEDAERLESNGTYFAYLFIRQGKVVTVPVN